MRKEILEALTTRFPGVAASILGRIANKLAKTATTAEQVKTAVEGVTIQQVIESYGDSRATEAAETARENAVKDYESRYGLKDGRAIEAPASAPAAAAAALSTGGASAAPSTGETDETPAWAKKLMQRLDRLETDRTTETRKQQLDAVIGKLPESMRKAYERIPLERYDEGEFAKMLGEITTEVAGIADATAAQGGVFGKPTAGNGGTTSTELSEAQLAAISRREGTASTDGQPF